MLFIAPTLFVLALVLVLWGQAGGNLQRKNGWLLGVSMTLVLLLGLYQSSLIVLPEVLLFIVLGTVVGTRLARVNTIHNLTALAGVSIFLTLLAHQCMLQVERGVYLNELDRVLLWTGLGLAAFAAATPILGLAGYLAQTSKINRFYMPLLGISTALVCYVADYPVGCGIGVFLAFQGEVLLLNE